MRETKGRRVILHGGPIITMNRASDVLPADSGIVCSDGKIEAFVSANERLESPLDSLYLGDGPILPAFLDAHVHAGMTNDATAHTVDCHTPPRSSIDEILDALREGMPLAAARQGWLVGQGSLMQDAKLRDGRLPTRDDLDRVSTSTPIVLRCGGHVTVLNTRALELSGITNDTKSGDAEVLIGDDHRPNGIILEGFGLVKLPTLNEGDRRDALRSTLSNLFLQNGVTHIGEISNSVESMEDLAAVADDVPVDIDVYVWLPEVAVDLDAVRRFKRQYEARGIRVKGIKIFVDGGFSAKTAAVGSPYVGGGSGELYYTRSQVERLVRWCADEGLQLIAHANGERAQALLWEACVAVGTAAHGTRVEHGGNVVSPDSRIGAWADAGLVAVTQPGFLYTMGPFMPRIMGPAPASSLFPYRSLIARGVPLVATSDVSGSELRHANPLFNAWCASAREGFNGEIIDQEESIDAIAALRLQALPAAAALGVDSRAGSIELGKSADFVALDKDPRTVHPRHILDISTMIVIKAGEEAWRRDGVLAAKTTN